MTPSEQGERKGRIDMTYDSNASQRVRPTLREIAREAGVALSTASLALRGKRRVAPNTERKRTDG